MDTIEKKVEFIKTLFNNADYDKEFLVELLKGVKGVKDNDAFMLGILYYSYVTLLINGIDLNGEQMFNAYSNMCFHIKNVCNREFYYGFYLCFMYTFLQNIKDMDKIIEIINNIDKMYDDFNEKIKDNEAKVRIDNLFRDQLVSFMKAKGVYEKYYDHILK